MVHVRINDSIDTVSDGDDSAVLENITAKGLLKSSIDFYVDSGLVGR